MAKSSSQQARKPGGGGPRIDWGAARTYFLSDPGVTYGDVSEKFSVSETSVGKHSRTEGWKRDRDALEQKAQAGATARVARSREDRIAKVLQVVDLVVDHVFEDLEPGENGSPKVRPDYARLPEFVKLAELLSGEATDRVSFDEMQAGFRTLLEIAARFVPKAKRAEFLAEVNVALGESE